MKNLIDFESMSEKELPYSGEGGRGKALAKVEVFVTSTKKLRAKISEKGKPPYEVTINGQDWNKGKGSEHKIEILRKMKVLVDAMNEEMKQAMK